jgi:hypothetical protein
MGISGSTTELFTLEIVVKSLFHVMSRGIEGRDIFAAAEDRDLMPHRRAAVLASQNPRDPSYSESSQSDNPRSFYPIVQ